MGFRNKIFGYHSQPPAWFITNLWTMVLSGELGKQISSWATMSRIIVLWLHYDFSKDSLSYVCANTWFYSWGNERQHNNYIQFSLIGDSLLVNCPLGPLKVLRNLNSH